MKLFLGVVGALLLSMPIMAGSRMIMPPLSDNIAAPIIKQEEKPIVPKTVPELIRHYSKQYGVSEKLAMAIATCESGLNPNAKNKNSSAGGTFQFITATWNSNSKFYLGYQANKFDAEANVHVAIAKIKREGPAAWNASKKCWSKKL